MQLKWIPTGVLAVLALHSAAYGQGFLFDPAAGAAEFGDIEPSTQAAENLAGLVGVVLLLLAATATGGAVLLAREHPAGAWLAAGLGTATLSMGIYWLTADNLWDAGFYSFVGLALLATSGGMLWRQREGAVKAAD